MSSRDARMEFGIFLLNSLPPWKNQTQVFQEGLEQVRVAEELGFDIAWAGEHNARVYGTVGSVQLFLAAAAAQTQTIKLGAAVTRLPLHHPLHLAEDFAFVDQISKGRLHWGIGKGYDTLEFSSYDVDMAEKDARYLEGQDIVVRAWRDGRIKHHGEFFHIPGGDGDPVELYPKPYQDPPPPVFVMVTKSDESVVWAAKHGYSFILGPYPDRQDARRKADLYRSEAAAAGISEEDAERALWLSGQTFNVHVAETAEQAAKEFEDAFMWFMEVQANRGMFGFSPEFQEYDYYLDHRGMLLGTADQVAEQLAGFAEKTTLGNVVCWFDCGGQPQPQVLESMQRFSEGVVPQIRPAS